MPSDAQRKGEYVVAKGEVHEGELCCPRDVRVEGVVRGDAEVGGRLEIVGGRVEGAVRCAELRLREGAVVLGPVHVGGPRARLEPGASSEAQTRPSSEPQDEVVGRSGAEVPAQPTDEAPRRPRGGRAGRPPRVGRVPARRRRRR